MLCGEVGWVMRVSVKLMEVGVGVEDRAGVAHRDLM